MSNADSDGRRRVGSVPGADATAALFEYAPRPIAAVRGTDSPRIQIVNRAYLEQLDGRCVEDTDHGTFPRRVELSGTEQAVVRRVTAGNVANDVITKSTAAGQRRFAIRAVPAMRADVTAYLQYDDVTERRIRDQQLAVLRRVLRHDLRNDLTVLLGYARTIAETADDPGARDAARAMVDAAEGLRNVATSAGRMQCVTRDPEPMPLDDAIARIRRTIDLEGDGTLVIDGSVASAPVDSRVGVALEEVCRTFAEQGAATRMSLDLDCDDWATVEIDADASLSDQERAAFEGRDETQLRHATGIAPWIARWAVRAAGGRLQVRAPDDGTRIAISAPILGVAPEEDGGDAETTGIEQ